jgi:hypothetical protein
MDHSRSSQRRQHTHPDEHGKPARECRYREQRLFWGDPGKTHSNPGCVHQEDKKLYQTAWPSFAHAGILSGEGRLREWRMTHVNLHHLPAGRLLVRSLFPGYYQDLLMQNSIERRVL